MMPDQRQLLDALGSGVRPFDSIEYPLKPSDPGFRNLLSSAIHGDPQSGMSVSYAPAVSGMFSTEDKHYISEAVDRAAVIGVDTALILHNQRILRVDVRNRVVLESQAVSAKSAIDAIDGFSVSQVPVKSKHADDATASSDSVHIPARIVRNASLVQALAGQPSTTI